jgi:hypothetical protein
MNVSGAIGITAAQLANLKGLGAIQDPRLLQEAARARRVSRRSSETRQSGICPYRQSDRHTKPTQKLR